MHRGDGEQWRPQTALTRVAEYYRQAVGAGPGDAGVLSLNPMYAAHRGAFKATWGRQLPYELRELAAVIPFGWRMPTVKSTGIGRNVDLFRAAMRESGEPSYAGVAGGQVASSVTGLYPWVGYQVSDRISVWGVTGYGWGALRLEPEGGAALKSDLSMAMAAAGTRGEIIGAGGTGGFELAFKADALWVGTSIDGVDGSDGHLAATRASVTRFRTGLEGSRGFTFGSGLSLTPSLEVGLRHDGGDAETGSGVDIGGGVRVLEPSTGLSVDVRVRMLLVHESEGFQERGMSVSFSLDPTPSTPLGLTARVAPSWGGQATGGAGALWGRETMAGMAHGSVASGNRLDAGAGYGLPVGSRFVGTPRVGFATSEYGRDYRLGYSLGMLGGEDLDFELGVDAQRRVTPIANGADHGVLGRATVRW